MSDSGNRHAFEAVLFVPSATQVYTEEAAKSLIGQTVPIRDGLAQGGFEVEAAVPYEVRDAWLDGEGRVVARLRCLWADNDPRVKALQRVRRMMASGEFERRFHESFDANLTGIAKRDDALVEGRVEEERTAALGADIDDLPPDLLADA